MEPIVILAGATAAPVIAYVRKKQAAKRKKQQEEERQQAEKEARERQAERERTEKARAEAEAARIAADQEARAAQAITVWKGGIVPTAHVDEKILDAMNELNRLQARRGKYLHVISLIGPMGIILEWKVQTSTAYSPQVTGFCDGDEMFTEWAFEGRHQSRLSPGRHFLVFHVDHQDGRESGDPDVAFEFFVPEPEHDVSIEAYEEAIMEKADEIMARARAVANAKRKIRQALTEEGNDPDEIDVELAKFEMAIKESEIAKLWS